MEVLNNGIRNHIAAYYLDGLCGRRLSGRQQMDRQAAYENEMVEGTYKMSKKKITAREAQRAYLNAWRAKNKDKVKQYNERYWQRKAEKMQEQIEEV